MHTSKFEQITVEFIDKMGTDKSVVNAAKVSFAKWDDNQEITEADKGLLAYLATGLPKSEREDWEKRAKAHTHFTPFCHTSLTVRVKVPIFVARQLHKHVVGLIINEESRRYIKDDVSLWLPGDFHYSPDHAKQGASDKVHNEYVWTEEKEGLDYTAKEVVEIATENAVGTYYKLLDAGVAPEEARMVLPLNTMVQWVWTGSLLAFNRVYQLRSDSHAQKTGTQEFAAKLGVILYEHFPHSMKALNS